MTWNPADLHAPSRTGVGVTPIPPAPAQVPRQAVADVVEAEAYEEVSGDELPLFLRRELREAGLVDGRTWANWRRLVTRGIPEW